MRNSYFRGIFPALLLAAMPALAGVDVTFRDPDRFTDIEGNFKSDEKDALDTLARHLQKLGDRYLAAGQSLSIEVLDVDLAGRMRWLHDARRVRVLNDKADWPRITLRYTLTSGGTRLDSREETISDPGYLQFRHLSYTNETLPYEKRMLDEWFKERFAERRAAR